MDEEGYYGGARFSFDDRYIAFVGSDRTFQNATHDYLFVYDTQDDMRMNLTEYLDAPVGDHTVADHQQGAKCTGGCLDARQPFVFPIVDDGRCPSVFRDT